jgi:hypothetical protein
MNERTKEKKYITKVGSVERIKGRKNGTRKSRKKEVRKYG